MTLTETAQLLTLTAAYDRRTLGETDVRAWHDLLADVDYDDAVAAVKAHYTATRDWLMPADILDHVRALRRSRLAKDPVPAPPPEIADDPARYSDWMRAQLHARTRPHANGQRPEVTR